MGNLYSRLQQRIQKDGSHLTDITFKMPTTCMAMSYVLFFIVGSYFCYDNPGALQDNFISDMGLTTSEFVYLYSWYSWPNVVLCFVGGFLMDR
jgi:hypothetical protein